MEIKDLRNKIDEIDDQLIKLLENRFLVISEIKDFKKIQGLSTYDIKRELEILEKVKTSDGSFDDYLKSIFKEILKQSKEFQNE